MRRRYSARIVNSGSIEEEKKKEEFLNQSNTSNSETDEEMKRRLYPEMFAGIDEKPSQETYVLQNGVVENKYKTDAFVSSKGSYTDKNTYQKIDNIIEDRGFENKQLSEVEETPEALPLERYEDIMIHSRKPLMPHEYRFLSDDDRVRLTGSNNRGIVYLYNIPVIRSNLHSFSLYVHDGQSWRPIPYRNIPVSRYEGVSNQLRSLGYMIGSPLPEGFQHWFFGRNSPVEYHNNSQPTVDASQISITDRILPGKLFKLIDSGSGSLREYNFEYERGPDSNNRNNGIDVPIDFNAFEAVPEFSQISRYQGARGLMSNSKIPYQFLIGLGLGLGIMHVLHKKKIM
jgi:hypothetical protein